MRAKVGPVSSGAPAARSCWRCGRIERRPCRRSHLRRRWRPRRRRWWPTPRPARIAAWRRLGRRARRSRVGARQRDDLQQAAMVVSGGGEVVGQDGEQGRVAVVALGAEVVPAGAGDRLAEELGPDAIDGGLGEQVACQDGADQALPPCLARSRLDRAGRSSAARRTRTRDRAASSGAPGTWGGCAAPGRKRAILDHEAARAPSRSCRAGCRTSPKKAVKSANDCFL